MLRAMFLKDGLRLKNSIPPQGNPSLSCFGRKIKVPDFGDIIQTAGSWADLEESFSYSDFHDSDDNLKSLSFSWFLDVIYSWSEWETEEMIDFSRLSINL